MFLGDSCPYVTFTTTTRWRRIPITSVMGMQGWIVLFPARRRLFRGCLFRGCSTIGLRHVNRRDNPPVMHVNPCIRQSQCQLRQPAFRPGQLVTVRTDGFRRGHDSQPLDVFVQMRTGVRLRRYDNLQRDVVDERCQTFCTKSRCTLRTPSCRTSSMKSSRHENRHVEQARSPVHICPAHSLSDGRMLGQRRCCHAQANAPMVAAHHRIDIHCVWRVSRHTCDFTVKNHSDVTLRFPEERIVSRRNGIYVEGIFVIAQASCIHPT
jgi:hypothetical protein